MDGQTDSRGIVWVWTRQRGRAWAASEWSDARVHRPAWSQQRAMEPGLPCLRRPFSRRAAAAEASSWPELPGEGVGVSTGLS